jgi:hypothetical protein
MIMAGEEDKLIGVQVMKDMARDYRQEVPDAGGRGKSSTSSTADRGD